MLEIFVFIVKFIFGAILFFTINELIRETKRNLDKYKQMKTHPPRAKALEVGVFFH